MAYVQANSKDNIVNFLKEEGINISLEDLKIIKYILKEDKISKKTRKKVLTSKYKNYIESKVLDYSLKEKKETEAVRTLIQTDKRQNKQKDATARTQHKDQLS